MQHFCGCLCPELAVHIFVSEGTVLVFGTEMILFILQVLCCNIYEVALKFNLRGSTFQNFPRLPRLPKSSFPIA